SRYAAEAFRHMDRAPHPSIEAMAEFAAGDSSSSGRSEVERHLAACGPCRRRLEEYRQFVADCDTPATKNLSPEWNALRRRIQWHKTTFKFVRSLTLATDFAAVAGVAWLLIGLLTPSTAQLLAQAYYEQRGFDIRLAGAKHSEIHRQRGGDSAE